MYYSIGQVAELTGLPVSTLRYYDKEGLFPGLERTGGVRRFRRRELESLAMIECLKRSGLEIRDIRQFMAWCAEGSGTYPQRLALFVRQEAHVRRELERMERALALIRFKRWYYEQALRDGGEDRLRAMVPAGLPPEIRALYDAGHQDGSVDPPERDA